jgi:outer membrane protein OmpA-like peptidoglycan-associated protein
MRALVTALIILLWLLLGLFYKSTADKCCNSDDDAVTSKITKAAPAAVSDAPKTKPLGPLTFDWSDKTATTREGWQDMKSSLMASLSGEDKLEITGLYRSSEVNNTKFENLGLARSNEARQLFKELPDDRVALRGKLITDDVKADDKDFASVNFRTLKVTKNIKETEDRTLIYFPYNSTNKLDSREVEDYLDDVADRVKASGESIRLSGHTDSFGDSDYNRKLGQQRANIIKNYLVSKGVAAGKISTTSAGETKPIKGNDTKAGRAANRRTELQIIK